MNFDLGGYLLQNGITGLNIEAEKYKYYSWIGNWTSLTIIYNVLFNDQFKTLEKANIRAHTYLF